MAFLLVGVGGALGAIARYGISRAIQARANTVFPFGTLAANLIGPLLLGLLIGLDISGNVYLLLADGFLGAFTTFSTFMFEEISLFADNEKRRAAVYIASTLIIGAAVYFAGFYIGRLIV